MHMHGDLINGVSFLAALPVYTYMALEAAGSSSADHDNSTAADGAKNGIADHPHLAPEGPRRICAAFAATVLFSVVSFLTDSRHASYAAVVASKVASLGICLYQWPHPGQDTVVPQFLWSLLIYSANTLHGFAALAAMGFFSLVTSVAGSALSPVSNVSECFPALFGALGTCGENQCL
jgi:hypothetical protein